MAPIRCEICQNCHLDSVDALKIHFATQHLTSAVYVMVVLVHPEKANLRSKHLKCLFCLSKFPDFAGLSAHLRQVHPELNFPDDPPCVSEMFCLQCVEKFPTHPQLTTHFKVVHNLKKCPCPCEMPIGESDMTRYYKKQLAESPYNYNKEKLYSPADPRRDGKPRIKAPSVKEMLRRKRALERGEEIDEEEELDDDEDDDAEGEAEDTVLDDEDTEDDFEGEKILMDVEAEEVIKEEDEEEGKEEEEGGGELLKAGEILPEAGIKTFNQIFRYERHRAVWSCGCCKKDFLSKNELTEHMRAPDHEKSLTYLLATYKFGKLVSCVSHSIKLNGLHYLSHEEDPKFVRHLDGGAGAAVRDNAAEFRCPRCDEAFEHEAQVEAHLKESDCIGIPTFAADKVVNAARDRRTYSATPASSSSSSYNAPAVSSSSSSSFTIAASSSSPVVSFSAKFVPSVAAPAVTYSRRKPQQRPNTVASSSTPLPRSSTSSSALSPPPKRMMTVILSPEEASGIKAEQEIKIEIQEDNDDDVEDRLGVNRQSSLPTVNVIKSEPA